MADPAFNHTDYQPHHTTSTRVETTMDSDSLIVSKTDTNGIITYANEAFCKYAGYNQPELLGKPQSIVRHPDMPRAIFYLMWEHLKQDQEFFGYIKNLSKGGGYYWMFVSVAPVYEDGRHTGYMLAGRNPPPTALDVLAPLYHTMKKIENDSSPEQQIPMSSALLWQAIHKEFQTYAEFALSL